MYQAYTMDTNAHQGRGYMPRITDHVLKLRYQKLDRKEKETIGSALIKVNMGIGLPQDLRRAAEFLKGSSYIAKKGSLDKVIMLLQEDIEHIHDPEPVKTPPAEMRETLMNELKEFDEDHEVTAKERFDKHSN